MPLIELSDEEVTLFGNPAARQRLVHGTALLDRLGRHPKAGIEVKKLIKEHINPNAAFPELDVPAHFESTIVAPLRDQVTDLQKQLSEMRDAGAAATATARGRQSIDEGRAYLRAEGFLDDAIPEIEKIIADEGIPSYEAAAALYEKRQPKGEAISSSLSTGFDWGSPDEGDADHKALLKDPEKWKRGAVQKFFADTRASRARGARQRAYAA